MIFLLFFMPQKVVWEAYSNHTVRPFVRKFVCQLPKFLFPKTPQSAPTLIVYVFLKINYGINLIFILRELINSKSGLFRLKLYGPCWILLALLDTF